MKLRTLALCMSLVFAVGATAKSQDDVHARADAKVAQVSDTDAFLEEVERAVLMARRGDYGNLKRGQLQQVIDAKNELKVLLDGHDSAQELTETERVRFLNAHELITSTLRSDQKNRKICKREAGTGSRLAKVECLTVAQREARAESAARNMREMQRLNCRGNTGPETRC